MRHLEATFLCQRKNQDSGSPFLVSLSRLVPSLILALLAVSSVPPLAAATSVAGAATPAAQKGAGLSAPRIPLRFEPCLPVTCGSSSDWSYAGIGGRYSVLIGNKKIAFLQPGTKDGKPRVTTLEFVDSAADAKVIAGSRMLSEASYFTSSDPKQWHSHVPDYDSVTLQNVYPGIDLRFYERDNRLEFDVLAQPGADLNQVRFRVKDDAVAVQANGDLLAGRDHAQLTIHIPAAYQIDAAGHQLSIAVRFSQSGKDEVALKTGVLNKALATVIDPTVAFSTFLGQASGSSEVRLNNVAVDGSGNIWVSGNTDGPLPDLSSNAALNCSSCGDPDGVIFAAKFSSTGALLLVVELGDSEDDNVAMALDTSGNVYLALDTYGGSSANPVTPGAYQTTCGAYPKECLFLSKISSTGTLVYGTFLGGKTGSTNINAERGNANQGSGAIQVDSQGDLS